MDLIYLHTLEVVGFPWVSFAEKHFKVQSFRLVSTKQQISLHLPMQFQIWRIENSISF